jgi:hypothetical protein
MIPQTTAIQKAMQKANVTDKAITGTGSSGARRCVTLSSMRVLALRCASSRPAARSESGLIV